MEETLAATPERSAKDVADRARAIYSKTIKARVEPTHTGEMLVLDVETGDYEFDVNEDLAFEKIEARRPEGVFYVMRIGYPAAFFIGTSR